MTMTNNEQLEDFTEKKEEFFNTLFEKQVTKYQQSTNGQFINTKIVCNNPALDNYFQKLFRDYKVKESWLDFYSECVYHSYMSILRFEIQDDGDWDELIAGTDKPNMGRLITNVKTTVKHEIYRYINDGAKFTRGEVDGVKGQHVTLKFDMKSLDALLTSDGQDGTVIDLISEEQNFFHSNDEADYQVSHFAKWFKENKERLLEPSQIIFLAQLEKARKVEGYTIDNVEDTMKMSNSAVNSRLRRIKNRIAKLWIKENDRVKNRLEITIETEMELWQPLLDLLDDEDLINQNQKINDWILENVDSEKVANMLYDPLNEEQSIKVTKAIRDSKKAHPSDRLTSSTIYTFITGVMDRIEELKNTNTTVTSVTKVPNYKMKMYNMQKKEWNNASVKVTDLEGNFIREEKQTAPKRKMNIQLVLPSGAHLVLGE